MSTLDLDHLQTLTTKDSATVSAPSYSFRLTYSPVMMSERLGDWTNFTHSTPQPKKEGAHQESNFLQPLFGLFASLALASAIICSVVLPSIVRPDEPCLMGGA